LETGCLSVGALTDGAVGDSNGNSGADDSLHTTHTQIPTDLAPNGRKHEADLAPNVDRANQWPSTPDSVLLLCQERQDYVSLTKEDIHSRSRAALTGAAQTVPFLMRDLPIIRELTANWLKPKGSSHEEG
jgi:hypothetical protein